MRQGLFFSAVIVALWLAAGCARPNLKDSLAGVQAPQIGPMLLAIYQPWFGQKDHLDVGYSCHDPGVLRQQIGKAKDLNIGGFVVNWYGPRQEFEDRTFALLQKAAHENNFKIAAQYDEAVDHPGYATEAVVVDLQYLYDKYLSPEAGPSRDAYLRYNGKPVIFIFPKDARTDWNHVREVTQGWPDPPVLIYEDGSEKFPDAFDGFYAWVQPGEPGWARDGSNWGEDYLKDFYKRMSKNHPSKIVVGAVWPGFDDTKASWSLNRHIANRCGKTFEDGLKLFRRYQANQNSPYLLIETWNDYEEGTAVEKGINSCNQGTADSSASSRGGAQ